MNVVDGAELSRTALTPALDKIQHEIIPALDAALQARIDGAVTQFSNIVAGTLQGLQAVADKGIADLNTTLAGLDGWTCTINIQPITITLKAPRK